MIFSAGAFVSALVVGFVAIYVAPFAVAPTSFVRDVLFYLTAALFLFCVYLSGFGGGGGDRNVSVEIESGSGGNMGEFEKRKAVSRIQHAFNKVCFEY
ncbi:hypothetical protein HanXRQr2_Chr12g0534101 [Helianthus annuus]|uniref:Uncharacterized protein n=1 Tax=Helianthus annuus TaxID=4232 RepID=A0A251URX2_HELAN|nr:hypothetical protein HanXRQr2_Chr12g0534101 [Helianthus annuus]KAJ0488865.1 hypothetical protein HanHA300_Chr12g0437631 [Helianthus annuus]KAJ0492460.1 hypothetical protein HanIR_Chr12g0575191 [Helianthus annuus]KAJ0504705.1 hypothetical protein HanHA89_Chr12g0462291 [Helianthus annuus]KAJ0674437.1 hypothetical protein HanLR1_Chr12g0439971 [Helianthus annuus]